MAMRRSTQMLILGLAIFVIGAGVVLVSFRARVAGGDEIRRVDHHHDDPGRHGGRQRRRTRCARPASPSPRASRPWPSRCPSWPAWPVTPRPATRSTSTATSTRRASASTRPRPPAGCSSPGVEVLAVTGAGPGRRHRQRHLPPGPRRRPGRAGDLLRPVPVDVADAGAEGPGRGPGHAGHTLQERFLGGMVKPKILVLERSTDLVETIREAAEGIDPDGRGRRLQPGRRRQRRAAPAGARSPSSSPVRRWPAVRGCAAWPPSTRNARPPRSCWPSPTGPTPASGRSSRPAPTTSSGSPSTTTTS